MRYAILVVQKNGDEDYVSHFTVGRKPQIVTYRTKHQAQEQVDFLNIGMKEDVQSINIVNAPPALTKEK